MRSAGAATAAGLRPLRRLDHSTPQPAATVLAPRPERQHLHGRLSARCTCVQGIVRFALVQVSAGRAAAWGGTERWLSLEEFSNQLHRPPFHVLLGCDSWQVRSSASAPPGALQPLRVSP